MTSALREHETICPYLGMKNDPTSHMAFPAPLNYCHFCSPSAAVNFKHQEEYCLDQNYSDCEVYINGENKRLPKSIRMKSGSRPEKTQAPLWWLIVIGVLVASVTYWGIRSKIQFPLGSPTSQKFEPQTPALLVEQIVAQTITAISAQETAQALLLQTPTVSLDALTPLATGTVTPFPTLTYTPTNTPTVTLTSTITRTPTPSFTPSPTMTAIPPFALGYPTGAGIQKYMVYLVELGENINSIATKFNTSPEAIQAVNHSMQSPLWSGSIMVVPLDVLDPAGLPVLMPYKVPADQMSIEEISAFMGSDLELTKYYNGCEAGRMLPQGSWVLIPLSQEVEP